MHGTTKTIAHRGASAYAPELTTAALDLALAQGADGLEVDVRPADGGELFLFHDETVQRTARLSGAPCLGPLAAWAPDDVAALDVGSWFGERHPDLASPAHAALRPLRLDDFLDRYAGRATLHVEMKDPSSEPGIADRLLTALGRRGLLQVGDARAVVVQSFDLGWLVRLRGLAPTLSLLRLVEPGAARPGVLGWDVLAAHQIGVGLWAGDADASLVTAARGDGLPVRAYTVNREADMARLTAIGVDGIITDVPDRLRHVLSRTAGALAA